MHTAIKRTLALALVACATHATAQVTFFENDNFQGRTFTADRPVGDFERFGFNDRASSVLVEGGRWEACEDVRFGGRCVVLRPGHYPSLSAMRLAERITSVRPLERDARVDESRYAPSGATSQVVFYERDNFEGRSLTLNGAQEDLRRSAFNDRASSMMVFGERWEVCEETRYSGRCVVFPPGRYPSLGAMGLGNRVTSVRSLERLAVAELPRALPPPVPSKLVIYERENFEGRSMGAEQSIENLNDSGFNNRVSSVVVVGDRWEACTDSGYRGRCVFLVPGRYPSLNEMGMNNSISSLRMAPDPAYAMRQAPATAPWPAYDSRRRADERLFETPVTSVRAVYAVAEQRCWIEHGPATPGRGANVGGGVVGALIGGILGHQVGGGSGRDLATVGGAIAGAVVGANVGRGNSGASTQGPEVQRCSNSNAQAAPLYWDVVYSFRGQEHQVQMSAQPGPTLIVNGQGEPRT